MKTIQATITIERPIEEVFEAATNFRHLPNWRMDLIHAKITSEGPVQTGSTYLFNMKVMGRAIDTTGEVEKFESPRLYAWKATSGPFLQSGNIRFETTKGGTHVLETIHADPGGFFKLAEPLLMKQQQNQMERDLRQLKDLLENGNSSA